MLGVGEGLYIGEYAPVRSNTGLSSDELVHLSLGIHRSKVTWGHSGENSICHQEDAFSRYSNT